MHSTLFRIATAAAVAGGLWVVPSVGTQGQGTLGDRFSHTDRALVGGNSVGRAALIAGDDVVASAVERF